MKKAQRILFVVYAIIIFLFASYVLYVDLQNRDFWESIKLEWTYGVVLFFAVISILSIVFNLEKLREYDRKSAVYKFTRVADWIFSFLMALISSLGVLFLIVLYAGEGAFNIYKMLLSIGMVTLSSVISFFMLFDNFKFHRSFQKSSQRESIDDIGNAD